MVESGTSWPSFMMRCSCSASGPPLSTSALNRSPVRDDADSTHKKRRWRQFNKPLVGSQRSCFICSMSACASKSCNRPARVEVLPPTDLAFQHPCHALSSPCPSFKRGQSMTDGRGSSGRDSRAAIAQAPDGSDAALPDCLRSCAVRIVRPAQWHVLCRVMCRCSREGPHLRTGARSRTPSLSSGIGSLSRCQGRRGRI